MHKILASLFCLVSTLTVMAQHHEPELVVPIGHTAGITSVDISPNGKFVLTGSRDQTAKIWDWSGHEIHTLKGHANEVLAVAYSPKTAENPDGGKYILTGSSDYTAILRNARGEKIDSFEQHDGPVTSVAISSDGKHFLTGSEDKTALLWANSSTRPQVFQHEDAVTSVAFSPNGNFVLVGCKNKMAVLWKLSGEKQSQFSTGHTAAVLCVAFSPGGDSILTGAADGNAILWSVRGGKLQTFPHTKEVRSVSFSADGKKIATASSDGTLKIWSQANTEPQVFKAYVRKPSEGSPGMGGIKFSLDGKFIVAGSDRESEARIISTTDGQLYNSLKGHTSAVTSLTLSPNGQLLMTGHANRATKIWHVMNQEVQSFFYSGRPNSVAFSPKTTEDSIGGKFVLVGCEDKTTTLQNLGNAETRSFKQANRAAFSPDGKSIATTNDDGKTQIWNLVTNVATPLTHTEEKVTALAFSPNGKSLAIGSDNGAIIYWDSAGAAPTEFPKSTSSFIYAIAFSPDGKSIVYGSEGGLTEIIQLQGAVKKAYPNRFTSTKSVRSVAFSPKTRKDQQGGKYVLRATGDNAELWEAGAGKVKIFSGHTSEVTAVAFSSERENIVTGSKDGTIKIWEIASGKEIATLIALDSSDWVVMHPSGLFDASPGAMRLMYYMYEDEMLEFRQLKTRFYEPYLFQKILGIKPGGLRAVDELSDVKLYPEVREWTIKNDTLGVLLIPRNGGIGRVALLLDGFEVLPDANPTRKFIFTVDLKQFEGYHSAQNPNRLSMILHNGKGDLPSQPFPLVANDDGVTSRDPTNPDSPRRTLNTRSDVGLENIHFYALVVGTSIYRDEKLKLTYPEKDAAIFADALEKAGKELFKERTIVKLLSTADADPKKWPRKAEIRKAMQDIAAKAGPDDILMVYFSGHGLTYKAPSSQESQFYYLTTDIMGDNLENEDILNAQAVAQDSLMEWVRKVKARKRILIYDACNSGSVVENMEGAKDLTSDQRKALERINERSGMFVLTGSAADKSSYEANTYGHGLLTYSLLNGMLAVAGQNDAGNIELGNLFDFVENDVRELAKKIDREQKPEVIKAESYPIGQIKENTGIKRPSELNVFVRTNLNVRNEGVDLLDVSKALNAELVKLAAERKPKLVFWGDVSSFSGKYYLIGGEYQEEGEKITGTANLYQGRKKLTSFPIDFKKGKEKQWAEGLMFDVQEYLTRNPGR